MLGRHHGNETVGQAVICPYHPHSAMRAMSADIPIFSKACAGIKPKSPLGRARLERKRSILRCPEAGCPWVASMEQPSLVTEHDRVGRHSLFLREHYSEVE